MKRIQFYIAIVMLFPMGVFAQQGKDPVLFGEDNKAIDEAIVKQIGEFEQGNAKGKDVLFLQKGNQNDLNVTLQGLGNTVLGGQSGNENKIILDARSANSQYWLEQQGDNNIMSLTNVEGNGVNFQVTQYENNNSLLLDGAGNNQMSSLKIEQSGGMKIQIESNIIPFK
ncbi:hypothetical protein [Dyadobacter sp. CY326]|uniref:hypothetical protein n=1 Tax=Dyadobacter sp. CY326 TaxID=2907300 RepID=UPI001F2119F7|nr:hypothetical protein [Dyadobacter sp. CY326]MCE7065095.1 hypothetical protein [Dyadobacter sp. CY326]